MRQVCEFEVITSLCLQPLRKYVCVSVVLPQEKHAIALYRAVSSAILTECNLYQLGICQSGLSIVPSHALENSGCHFFLLSQWQLVWLSELQCNFLMQQLTIFPLANQHFDGPLYCVIHIFILDSSNHFKDHANMSSMREAEAEHCGRRCTCCCHTHGLEIPP